MSSGLASLIHAEYLFSRIPAHIRETLSLEHRQEVLNAFLKIELERNSPVKFDITLPFFFRRYYLLVWFGRDRRSSTVAKEDVRKSYVPWPLRAFFYLIVLWFTVASFTLLSFIGLYMLKSFLGIDIFPTRHLKDFVEILMDWIT